MFNYTKWTVGKSVFTAGAKGTFDDISVKDPTIVYHDGLYHMFYTSKPSKETVGILKNVTPCRSGTGYVSAKEIAEFNKAERIDLSAVLNVNIVAPQVFFFEPHKLWYLIVQVPAAEGRSGDLSPAYLTNPDIGNIKGWSQPEIIKTSKSNNGFWLDFWVICDEMKAHLFYTDHEGGLFRFECPVNDFPHGFAHEREETVIAIRGEDDKGRWRLHEASHIYYVKESNEYLALVEGVYPHPKRKNYWDSRSRFMFALTAKKLEGPWFRVEPDNNEFAGNPENLYNEDGSPSAYDQVSHFELIRSGINQKLEVDNYNLDLLFQAFDAEEINDDYDYNDLPWELALMKNYECE